ncbi:hypothetical protein [Streptomyces sp. NPDC047841]|uniref:hypothetical protein n=1 Tax=Streptomyces sp. NPDC047841 TaxID=3154708 RepID=UPI003451C94F
MCNTFTDRQVDFWLDDLNQLQRRDERILFGSAIATWIIAIACYCGVAYCGITGKPAATAACVFFGTLIGGWGVVLFKKAKRIRHHRRVRNRQVGQQRRQPPAAT